VIPSQRCRHIDCFVPADSIGWVWYDTPHYLVPDDKVGEEAFSVIREAMVKAKTRAISRVVLHHRERAVLLEPRDNGMILWTLRYGDEVRDEADLFQEHQRQAGSKGEEAACQADRGAHPGLVARTRHRSCATGAASDGRAEAEKAATQHKNCCR
jgi:Ku protein